MRNAHRGLLAALLLLLTLSALLLDHRPADPPLLTGSVFDGSSPVADALVQVKGCPERVPTDASGRFRLPARPEQLGAGRITAWKQGYLIAGIPLDRHPLRLTLHPLPTQDHADYVWVDPRPESRSSQRCAHCHGEIYREWATSGHARSATGRAFRDLYSGEGGGWGLLTQHPNGSGVCAACHAPTVDPADDAFLDLTRVRGVASLGVHCDYCHKIHGEQPGDVGLQHGRYKLTLLRPAPGEQLFFGPLTDVDRGEDAYSPFFRDSRYCAACHEGVVFGVHVYSTYSEWLDSPASKRGQHCQHCHLRPTGQMSNIAPGKGGIARDPHTLGNHVFFDGDQESMLRRCLKTSAQFQRSAAGVRVNIQICAEQVGHRVPTGFVDHHLILVVDGFDSNARPLPLRAGPVLPAPVGAELAGRPGRLYAKLLRDEEGKSPAPFWKADLDPLDTRLHPEKPDSLTLEYPGQLEHVRLRLIYRPFWQDVSQTKGWPSQDRVIVDRKMR